MTLPLVPEAVALPGRAIAWPARPSRRTVALAGGVALLVTLVFLPSLRNGFVDWDDTHLLVRNEAYRGLGLAELRWMATTTMLGHYVPLTWLSFAVDFLVWGAGPFGFHLTNVLLHGLNAGLVVLVGRWLLERATTLAPAALDAGAAAGGLAFGLHPLRAEAVSWVTGRRDLLAACWLLVALLGYLQAAGTPAGSGRRWRLFGSIGAYTLALLSKAIVMTAPVVLVVLDVYPLGRLPADPRRWAAPPFRRVWAEKIPFLALASGAAMVSRWAIRGRPVVTLDPPTWLGLVWTTLAMCLEKTVLPLGLSPLYELPGRLDPWRGTTLAAGLLVTFVALTLVLLCRRWPAGLATAVAAAALLAPVCATVHVGMQLTADRYTYLPGVGLALLAGGGVGGLVARRAWVALGAVALLLVAYGTLTVRQEMVWADPGRLWGQGVAATPECAACRVNLGNWLDGEGRSVDAIRQYTAALAVRPDWVELHTNVGMALDRLGRVEDAVSHYERFLTLRPDNLPVRVRLASALVRLDRRPEAVARLSEAVQADGAASLVEYFQGEVAAHPNAPVLRLGLTQAYLGAGDRARALAEVSELRRLDGPLATAVERGLSP